MTTENGMILTDALVANYMGSLIGRVYKILPMSESGTPTLDQYIRALRDELIGCQAMLPIVGEDGRFMSVLSTLEFLGDHYDDSCIVKPRVFGAIHLIKQMQSDAAGGDGT